MDNLFYDNLKLVKFIYKKYFSNFSSMKDELIQEGNISLWKIIPKYDESKGEFSTFAGTVIRNKMKNCIRKEINYRKHLISDSELYNGDFIDDYFQEVEKDEDKPNVGHIYKTIVNGLGDSKQKIINDWSNCQNTYKVAEKNSVSRQYVCKVVNVFKNVFKDEYEKNL